MPTDLPPGALEEMERLLPLYRSATGNCFFLPQEHTLGVYLWPQQMPALIALAREALTLRERVAGLTASLDACQAGHTQQAKRAEAERLEREYQQEQKDEAYRERNRLVRALAAMFPAGLARTDIPGWDPAWHGCVYIDTPAGQLSWHYHDSQAALFADLPAYTKPWDGHDTSTKYERLAALGAHPAVAEAARLRAALERLELMVRALQHHDGKQAEALDEIEAVLADTLRPGAVVASEMRSRWALRPAAPDPSCQGSLDNCPDEKDPDHG